MSDKETFVEQDDDPYEPFDEDQDLSVDFIRYEYSDEELRDLEESMARWNAPCPLEPDVDSDAYDDWKLEHLGLV